MHKMLEEKMNKLSEMKDKLLRCFETELTKGIECVDTKEAGEVVDMIKDLAEAEYYCACAEMKRHELMEAEEFDAEDSDMMGYNSRRYASGRYAPAGRGRVRGYNPNMYRDWPWNPMDPGMEDYYGGIRPYDQKDPDHKTKSEHEGRYGKAFNDYQMARRHYSETKNQADKDAMDTHASEHVGDTIATIREIWKTSDPNLKKRIKTDLTNLVGEMAI